MSSAGRLDRMNRASNCRHPDRTARCVITLTWTDGEVMFDDEYEVTCVVDIMEPGGGWQREFEVYDILISAPGGTVEGSRAIPEMLPSSWYLEAQDALLDQAAEDFYNSGNQYESDGS